MLKQKHVFLYTSSPDNLYINQTSVREEFEYMLLTMRPVKKDLSIYEGVLRDLNVVKAECIV